jgi:hypothetical protein
VAFGAYDWDTTYGSDASKRTAEGEDAAGIARRLLEVTLKGFTKVEKKTGPTLGKLTPKATNAMVFTVRGTTTSRVERLIRGYVFRARRAKKTIHVRIDESLDLPPVDPEWDAILATIEVNAPDR